MPVEPYAHGAYGTSLRRLLLGPWPIYPRAVAVLVAYGMLIRAIVRTMSPGVGGVHWVHLVLPNLITTVAVAAAAWAGAMLLRQVLDRPGAKRTSRRYVVFVLLESLIITAALVVLVRRLLPDGHTPLQPGVIPVAVLSASFVILTVAFGNGITGLVLQRFRREEELVRGERTMQLAAEERVRSEAARYLHDDVQTALLRASLRLVPLVARTSDSADQELLRTTIAEIDSVRSEGVRFMGRRLAPPLASTGLIVAMSELATSFNGVMAVDVDFDAATAGRFRIVSGDDHVALALYRISEQVLQNAIKHGRATHAQVSVTQSSGAEVLLSIDVDGAPPAKVAPGNGTAIINAWLDDVGGQWGLLPADGGGARFRATLGSRS
jgi:signal transduction histidine kinase